MSSIVTLNEHVALFRATSKPVNSLVVVFAGKRNGSYSGPFVWTVYVFTQLSVAVGLW